MTIPMHTVYHSQLFSAILLYLSYIVKIAHAVNLADFASFTIFIIVYIIVYFIRTILSSCNNSLIELSLADSTTKSTNTTREKCDNIDRWCIFTLTSNSIDKSKFTQTPLMHVLTDSSIIYSILPILLSFIADSNSFIASQSKALSVSIKTLLNATVRLRLRRSDVPHMNPLNLSGHGGNPHVIPYKVHTIFIHVDKTIPIEQELHAAQKTVSNTPSRLSSPHRHSNTMLAPQMTMLVSLSYSKVM